MHPLPIRLLCVLTVLSCSPRTALAEPPLPAQRPTELPKPAPVVQWPFPQRELPAGAVLVPPSTGPYHPVADAPPPVTARVGSRVLNFGRPFTTAPSVTPIGDTGSSSSGIIDGLQEEMEDDGSAGFFQRMVALMLRENEEKRGRGETAKFVYIFDCPASFTLPRFDAGGAPLVGDGLLIYEGMKVVVQKDGDFQVDMNVTIPARPVTLYLQLEFAPRPWEKDGPFTVTLPPITIRPRGNVELDGEHGLTFRVQHTGYSARLQRSLSGVNPQAGAAVKAEYIPALTRRGVVRFGSVIPSSLQFGLTPLTGSAAFDR